MRKGLDIDYDFLKRNIGNKSELADFMGITRNSLYKKLEGKVQLRLLELNQIAEYLNRDTSDFLKEVDLKDFGKAEIKRRGRRRKAEKGREAAG